MEIQKEDYKRLYQPNLTCTFHQTQSLDLRMRILTVVNKDRQGICDEQVITQIWTWANEYRNFLKGHNKKVETTNKKIDADIVISPSVKFDVFNVVVMSLDDETVLDDVTFCFVLLNFCANQAQALRIDLGALK